MIRFILLDIEGTVSDVDFVHKVLFPYSAERMAAFVRTRRDEAEVADAVRMVQETVQSEENRPVDEEGAIAQLLEWIRTDRKHTALKLLQGLIWQEGFETGKFKAHLYDDVLPCMQAWKAQGKTIGIYSSGSVHAQRLFFKYTEYGDLTGYLSHHFDTTVGGKKEEMSYRSIADVLKLSPQEMMFFSDVPEELEAAVKAGMHAVLVNRSENPPVSSAFPCIRRFAENATELTLLNR